MNYCFAITLIFITSLCFGQVRSIDQTTPIPNSEQADSTDSSVQEENNLADELNGLRSMILPGWGQYRNKQYIKATLFPASIIGSLVVHNNQNDEYKIYRDAYSSRLQNYDDPIDQFAGEYTLDELYVLRREELNKRDMMRGAIVYLYLINGVDAAAQYKIIREDPEIHSPTKAAYYSMVLPGLGQAYNKKYWKIPIVYAALGTSLYIANQNREKHRKFQKELEFRSVGTTSGYRERLTEQQLKDNLDYWRKWRDAAYIASAAVYLLNVVDATVDAQLYDFSVDDDLSFIRPEPKFGLLNGQAYYAVQLNITINQ